MTYSEEEAIHRFQQLDNSQSSVEATSKWVLTVKDMAKDVVKLWFKEFRKASPKKKIAFLHLANDVVQNGVTVAPQYGKLFEPVLPTAFKETSKIQRHSIRNSAAHLLIVWASRRIYSKSFLRQLRFICQRAVAEADAPGANEEIKKNIISASPFAFSFTTVLMNGGINPAASNSNKEFQTAYSGGTSGSGKHRKRHRTSKRQQGFAPTESTLAAGPGTHMAMSQFREELARELQTEAIQPPEILELVEMLEKLQETTASGDASTRRAIAQFPPEVSDSNKVAELITDISENEQRELITRITDCSTHINQYNEQLEEEANQRHKLSLKLRAYHLQLKEGIKQYELDLKDLEEKHTHGLNLKQELVKHMSNLPDLQLLPDMTVGLDPLPTVSDLFG